MANTAVAAKTPKNSAKKPKAAGGATAKKPKAKRTHPKTSDMVYGAIKELKERRGSSLQAIKKYIAAQYKVDAERLAPYIRKYLKSAVESGALIQTTGKGASGSFKLESKSSASRKQPTGRRGAAVSRAKSKKSSVSAAVGRAKKAASSPAKSKRTKAATKDRKAAAAKKKPAAAKRAPAKAKGTTAATPRSKPAAKLRDRELSPEY